jgi:branched-subunit amino acid ABC-type transport system permease component
LHTLFLGLGFGFVTASTLFLATVALSMQFSSSNHVPNFALGDFMTVGAYAGYEVLIHTNQNLFLAACAAAIAGGLVSLIFNSAIVQPLLRKGIKPGFLIVVMLGASLVIQSTLQIIYSPEPLPFHLPTTPPLHLGPFLLTSRELGTIALALAVLAVVHVMLRYTLLGRSIRAIADSPELARVSGVHVERIINVTWALAGALTGLAGGTLAATVGTVYPTLGFSFLFVIFAAAIVGGVDRPYAAAVGALLIGVVTEVSAFYVSSNDKTVVAFVILVGALILRPQGLFPRKTTSLSI